MSKPGLMKDPWRKEDLTPIKPPPRAVPVAAEPDVDKLANDDIDKDSEDRKITSIELKNYGGIAVEGTTSTTQAAAQILKFCVSHVKDVENILLDFGVVLAKLPVIPKSCPFYIQQADGWTLAIPDVTTRDQGCLQLIQAFLKLKGNPKLSTILSEYRIKPFRV